MISPSQLGLLFLCLTFTTHSANAADWPNYRGPEHNGIYEEKGLLLDFDSKRPEIVWKADIHTGFSSIVTSQGRVYSMGHNSGEDHVFCIDEKSGKVLWSSTYKAKLQPNLYEGGPNATPTVYDGRVYTLGKHGQFYCWDAQNGKMLWSVDLRKKYKYESPGWGFSSSPFISDDLVIVNAGTAGIAFKRKTGDLVWKSDRGKASYSSVVPYMNGDTQAILLFAANRLKCLAIATGKLLWELDWETSYDVNSANPVVVGRDIFISSGYGKGAALIKVQGSLANFVWASKVMRNQFSSSIIKDGFVYGVDGNTTDRNASLKCVRLKDGREMWSESLGFGSLVMANDKILFLREKGQLVSVDAQPKLYKENGRVQILGGKCWTSPIVSNGHLWARNARGDLVKVRLK